MLPFFSYFDGWHDAPLRGNELRPRNWVFPTLKVKKNLMGCGIHVPHLAWGFWLFTGWKNLFWARYKVRMIGASCELSIYVLCLCLCPLSGTSCHLNQNKKKNGVISFWGSPFKLWIEDADYLYSTYLFLPPFCTWYGAFKWFLVWQTLPDGC